MLANKRSFLLQYKSPSFSYAVLIYTFKENITEDSSPSAFHKYVDAFSAFQIWSLISSSTTHLSVRPPPLVSLNFSDFSWEFSPCFAPCWQDLKLLVTLLPSTGRTKNQSGKKARKQGEKSILLKLPTHVQRCSNDPPPNSLGMKHWHFSCSQTLPLHLNSKCLSEVKKTSPWEYGRFISLGSQENCLLA